MSIFKQLAEIVAWFAFFAAVTVGVFKFARWTHADHCTGPDTGRCSWAWCRYYDGSDWRHDFSLCHK